MPLRGRISGLIGALALWLAMSVAALAQEVAPPDYEAWNETAARAEAAIEAGRASDAALEALRVQIASYREGFTRAQQTNVARIKTLEDQIAALGTTPEGEEEIVEITERRAALTQQLSELRAPRLRAEEAFARADGLITSIDGIIRERQTNRLVSRGPMPINPAYWSPAYSTLVSSLRKYRQEIASTLNTESQRSQVMASLPVAIPLFLVGLVLIFRGRRWADGLGARVRARWSTGRGVWSFLISLAKIVVPLAGFYLITEALFVSNTVGLRWTQILAELPRWAGLVLGLRWLADRLFPREAEDPVLRTPPQARRRAHLFVNLLAWPLIGHELLVVIAGFEQFSAATFAVLSLPLVVFTGWFLFRLGVVFQDRPLPEGHSEDEPGFRFGVIRALGRMAIVVAVLAPLMAAVGYTDASVALIYPAVLSLALLGLLVVLQGFVGDLYDVFAKAEDSARDALIPVLIGFALALASLPVLALIWGARVADLTELWTQVREGVVIGDSRISATNFLTFAVIFAVGYTITRLLQGGLRSTVLPKTSLDAGACNAIVSGTGYVGIFLAAVVAITAAGIDLSSLAIVAGALSVGIGFGLQNIVSNFVSGIILLIERPISEGDWIEVGGTHGTVRDISVRSTRIETFDRSDVIVPNSDLISGKVTNYTRGKTIGRVIVPVGVAFGTDTRRVESILLSIAREHEMVLMNPAPSVVFQGFGADSLDFEIRAILRDVNYVLSVRSQMNHEIARRFVEEGIEIPFAQREILIKNIDALNPNQNPTAGGDADAADAKSPKRDQE